MKKVYQYLATTIIGHEVEIHSPLSIKAILVWRESAYGWLNSTAFTNETKAHAVAKLYRATHKYWEVEVITRFERTLVDVNDSETQQRSVDAVIHIMKRKKELNARALKHRIMKVLVSKGRALIRKCPAKYPTRSLEAELRRCELDAKSGMRDPCTTEAGCQGIVADVHRHLVSRIEAELNRR